MELPAIVYALGYFFVRMPRVDLLDRLFLNCNILYLRRYKFDLQKAPAIVLELLPISPLEPEFPIRKPPFQLA